MEKASKTAFDGQKLDKTASVVVKLLIGRNMKVASAESCTGGMVSAAITSVSGSSQVFDLGVCTYANEMKMKLLGVSADTLTEYGAVSPQTAEQMADGVRKLAGADYGVSTTGIAGPGGAIEGKPVGTVYIAVSTKEKTISKLIFTDTENLGGETDKRGYVRMSSTLAVLEMLAEIMVQS